MTPRHVVWALAAAVGAALQAVPAQAAAAEAPKPPYSIDLQVVERTESATGYVITVHNNSAAPQQAVVTQRFAQKPQEVIASDAGQVAPEGETVAWTIALPQQGQSLAFSSEALFAGQAISRSTICMTDQATSRVLDCTSGDTAGGATAAQSGVRWAAWLTVLGIVLAVAGLGYLLYRLRGLWWPRLASFTGRRRSGLAVVLASVVLIALAAGAFALVLNRARVAVHGPEADRAMGWSGQQVHTAMGIPAGTKSTEFTIYQWSCTEQAARQCVATVAMRNVSDVPQSWFRRMQRLHHAPDSWAEPDPAATAAANGGADIFGTPLLAGERRLGVLVFLPADQKPLTRLELREGAFSRGVALDLA